MILLYMLAHLSLHFLIPSHHVNTGPRELFGYQDFVISSNYFYLNAIYSDSTVATLLLTTYRY